MFPVLFYAEPTPWGIEGFMTPLASLHTLRGTARMRDPRFKIDCK